MPVWLASLLKDPKFYTALLAFAQVVLFYLRPTFPMEIWTAFSALVGVIFAAAAGYSVNEVRKEVKAEAAQRG